MCEKVHKDFNPEGLDMYTDYNSVCDMMESIQRATTSKRGVIDASFFFLPSIQGVNSALEEKKKTDTPL